MTTNNATNTTLSSQTGSGTFVGSTSPTITTPVIATINDTNSHIIFSLQSTTNAVNYLLVATVPIGSTPEIQAQGADTDISITHRAKGTGFQYLISAHPTIPTYWYSGTGSQHVTQWQMANTSADRFVTIPDLDGTLLMAGQAFSNIVFRILTSTSTVAYVPTTGTKYAIFDVMGSGGSGGAMGATGSGQGAATGGGGGGGYWRLYATAANMAGGVSYSVGVGGAAPTAGFPINGNNGTNTVLTISSGTAWQAGGGFGGFTGGGAPPFGQVPGGAGGGLTAGTNAVAMYGGNGDNGQDGILLSVSAYNMGGHGGGGLFGMGAGYGGYSGTSAAVGTAGRGYGAGGGGTSSINFGGALSAGAGANGVIIVMEFIGA